MSQQEVVIAGAGPTGLSLAITLRRFGVPVRIVDRAAAPAAISKALAVWSGSLEALDGMGVIGEFLATGQRLNALLVGDAGRQLAKLAIGEGIDSPYPFPLLLPQSRTEAILTRRLSALGADIERGVELVGLAQDSEGVTATLKHADGRSEDVRSRYLVGCDGARSFVRQTLGINLEGETEPDTFLLGDVQIDGGDLDHRSIYLWWHGGGTVALFPFEDRTWRIFAKRESNAGSDQTSVAELQQQVDRHGPPGLRLRDPSWLSVFRVNERVAAHYRAGRCFLAGDAAHIHSPAGGQGMNTGIQDAVNLGWKLAYVLDGVGDADLLLASYEAERRPIAQDVVKGAAQKHHAAFDQGYLRHVIKDVAISIFGNIPAVQRKLQVELSETEIVYHDGPLVALGEAPRRPGRTDVGARARDAVLHDRTNGTRPLWVRLSEGRHSLLLFEDRDTPLAVNGLDKAAGGRLQIIRLDPTSDPRAEARERYRLRGPGWVLVRPDQVVAARGEGGDLSALNRYVDRVLRAGASRH
jgi:2-polyprenyl-6-methoxyphenol hydroxylase-like FAD-dependent oxidoreductase